MVERELFGMFTGTTDLNVEVGSIDAQEIIVFSSPTALLLLFYSEKRPAD